MRLRQVLPRKQHTVWVSRGGLLSPPECHQSNPLSFRWLLPLPQCKQRHPMSLWELLQRFRPFVRGVPLPRWQLLSGWIQRTHALCSWQLLSLARSKPAHPMHNRELLQRGRPLLRGIPLSCRELLPHWLLCAHSMPCHQVLSQRVHVGGTDLPSWIHLPRQQHNQSNLVPAGHVLPVGWNDLSPGVPSG